MCSLQPPDTMSLAAFTSLDSRLIADTAAQADTHLQTYGDPQNYTWVSCLLGVLFV